MSLFLDACFIRREGVLGERIIDVFLKRGYLWSTAKYAFLCNTSILHNLLKSKIISESSGTLRVMPLHSLLPHRFTFLHNDIKTDELPKPNLLGEQIRTFIILSHFSGFSLARFSSYLFSVFFNLLIYAEVIF